jgi:5-methyltetrahydropteroyltriglutamate--homocysteine methyltransferase
MKRSTERILTTHTGSLPRPPDLLPLLLTPDQSSEGGNGTAELVRSAVRDAVAKQAAAGIDVVSDGEMGKPGFAHYIAARLTGFQGVSGPRPFAPRDLLRWRGAAAAADADQRWTDRLCRAGAAGN